MAIYVGRTPLPQLPWPCAWYAPLLLVSLFGGFGGALFALSALGMTFAAVTVELDSVASQVVSHSFRNVRQVRDVQDFDVTCLEDLLASRRFSLVMAIGGSPCQQVSRLNPARRAPQVAQDRRLLRKLRLRTPVLAVLENVEYGAVDFVTEASTSMQGAPLVAHAGSFGYVRHSRCFWVSDGLSSLDSLPELTPPAQTCVSRDQHGRWEACWLSKKPWQEGFSTVFSPVEAVRNACVLPVLSRAFHHPEDQLKGLDSATIERFWADDRQFPAHMYKEAALLWKGEAWRQPNSVERARIMGVPESALDCVLPNEPVPKREQAKCSLIGHGFHVPSVMLVIILACQLLPARPMCPPPLCAEHEQNAA